MDTDRLRESSDELDDPEDHEDQDDQMENSGVDTKDEDGTNNENGQENRSSVSRRSPSKRIRHQSKSKTPISQTRAPSHLNQPKRSWKSANAFINFVQDFKKGNPETVLGRNIFQICGEKWKNMSDEQKQPYIAAANSVKRFKNQKNVGENCEQQNKKSVIRVSKRKAEKKRIETSQRRSKAIKRDPKSNSDTDTATTTVHSSMSDAGSF